MRATKIRNKTLINFLAFTVIMLTLLWLLQILFFNNFYTAMKKYELQKTTNAIVDSFGDANFVEKLEEVAFKNELSVIIFVEESANNYNVIHKAGRVPPPYLSEPLLAEFLKNLGDRESVNYLTKIDSDKELMAITYGSVKIVNEEKVYFYVNSSFMPADSSTKVLQNQLLMITAICILLAILLSYIISRRISKPIEKLTISARELANGDLDVKFDADSFAELNELAATLNFATGELKKTDKLRQDLIANVSHELRTPLTIIKAYSEMIRDISGENKEKREKHLSIILAESDRLSRLVNDILDLSRLESGAMSYDMKEFNLSNTVKRVYNMFLLPYQEKGFHFEETIEDGIIAVGDEKRIEQVIFNLVGNAINYSGENKFVSVSLAKSGEKFRFECMDKGKGINSEDIPYVFDRFFRTEETNRRIIGSGIGLSLVKEILEAHNYNYGVDSELKVGSIFYFENFED